MIFIALVNHSQITCRDLTLDIEGYTHLTDNSIIARRPGLRTGLHRRRALAREALSGQLAQILLGPGSSILVKPRHASCGDKRFLAGEMDLEIDHRGRGSGLLSRRGDGHINVNDRRLRDILGLGPVQRWSQPAKNAPAAAIFDILDMLPHALAPEDLVHGCEHIVRYLPVENLQMARLFKNGEMRGTKKIQARSVRVPARVSRHT